MNSVKDHIDRLRRWMASEGLDAIYLPCTDPHMGEYLPSRWQVREFITGFTGSYGSVAVTADEAILWTDTRYFLQAELQLAGSGIRMMKLRVPGAILPEEWLASVLPSGSCIGMDLNTISIELYRDFEKIFKKKELRIQPVPDPFNLIWDNRPELPDEKIFCLDIKYAGLSRSEKFKIICSELEKRNSNLTIVSALDDLAWAFNLRGNDISYNPVFTGYGIIGPDRQILFTNRRKIPPELEKELRSEGIELYEYSDFLTYLENLRGFRILLDPLSTACSVRTALEDKNPVAENVSVITLLKVRKNPVEIEGFRSAMRKDGVALVKFLCWLKNHIGSEKITEFTVGRQLALFRNENEGFRGESFPPIVGYRDHGSLVHFTVSEENANSIEKEGLLLFDSGGHYNEGTTDVTRTVALGKVTQRQKTDFTLALKGVIALSTVRFPLGTKGCHLDILARKALWDNGLNYGHGTGHGVGHFLNVHEGPMAIRQEYNPNTIEPGMVLSNEPALYRDGQYGIRTENMMVCVEAEETEYGKFLGFETLTLCPIDLNLIEKELLTDSERVWINSYHRWVRKELTPLLEPEFQDYLREITAELLP